MNPLSQLKKTRILSVFVILVALTTVPAHATPSCGLTSANLLDPVPAGYFPNGLLRLMCNQERDFRWFLRMDVKGDSDLYITQNTFEPGGQSGWHTHPGPSLITVTEGTITAYEDDCTSTTYNAGESFTDIGCGDVHDLVNESGTEAKTIAVQIVPHGATRRIDASDPGCANVPPCQAY